MQSAPWDAAVLEVKERVEELAGSEFNACLLNLYRSGQDNLGWHSDNEKSLDTTIGTAAVRPTTPAAPLGLKGAEPALGAGAIA